MKKQFVIASSLITQMAHLGQAAAHSANPELQNQLANYLKEEAQKPASAQSSRTYQSDADGGVVVIKKLRSPFRHIAKRTNFAAKMNISAQMTSSSDTGNNNTSSSSNVVNTSSSEVTNPPVTSSSSEVSPAPATPPVVVAPTAPTSSSDVSPQPGPTSSSDSNQNTSSSSQQNPPTTSSSARCAAPFKPFNAIKTYGYQVTLNSVQGVQAAQGAPYYFANKVRQSADAVVYQVYQFDRLSDLAHPKATAYLVVHNQTKRVTFSKWTVLK